ncbi:hypothetical protein MLD38_013867 [Melastoma candidum]|uniref:Uncharacterized protein n=1 Tax=Melastoma candidum TaxID=119954 RepID=A0ACB9RC50_9MYRT|nr:hypothetical protein MLD38_013867 [Melastoma candidum]
MKIMCDVCGHRETSVFCSADEAALCNGCDRRVHGANKLASQHKRHALSRFTRQESPLCDVCQESHALFFCREDRAILCRGCDLHIHTVNEYTRRHDRFLLTGVKISLSASLYQASPSSYGLGDADPTIGQHDQRVTWPSQSPVKTEIQTSSGYSESASGPMAFHDNHGNATSSISEYFTKTLPGWRVDDFLDPHPQQLNGYCKV